DHLGHERGHHRVPTRRMHAVAIRGEASSEAELRLTAGNEIEHRGAGDCADDLDDDVGGNLRAGKAATSPEPDRDGRVEMAPGYWAERIGASEHRETEGKRHAEEP